MNRITPSTSPRSDGGARPSAAPEEAKGVVLLIAPEAQQRRAIARILMAGGQEVLTAQDDEVASTLLTGAQVEVVLIDVAGRREGLRDRIEALRAMIGGVEVVLLAAASEAEGLDDSGAYDVVVKPWATERVVSRCVERAIERVRLVGQLGRYARRLEQQESAGEMIGASRAMDGVFSMARGAAPVTAPVLLIGPGGVGKEMLARAIHRHGPRAGRAFVAVDCAAIPADRLTAELFGDPTGGAQARGLVRAARGGTIFLADIDAASADGQARLVRLVQFGELHEGAEPHEADVRLIASTCVELKPLVDGGQFRSDLYYQLNVIAIRIPPLRRRKEDIPLLAYNFLHLYGRRMGRAMQRISPEALRMLRAHPWPGNVRELEHAMERAVAMSRGEVVLPGDLAFLQERAERGDSQEERATIALPATLLEMPFAEAKQRAVGEFERRYADEALRRAGGNISEAARLAGLDRSNFRRLLRKSPKRRRKTGG